MKTIRVPLPGASQKTTIEVTRSEIEVLIKTSEATNGHRTAQFWREQLARIDGRGVQQ